MSTVSQEASKPNKMITIIRWSRERIQKRQPPLFPSAGIQPEPSSIRIGKKEESLSSTKPTQPFVPS